MSRSLSSRRVSAPVVIGACLVVGLALVAVGGGAPSGHVNANLAASAPDNAIPATATPATGVPADIEGDRDAALPTRGERLQVTPTQPPPPSTTTTTLPPPDSCPAGALIRSVNTWGERLVTFTFDDGPSPTNTPAIMNAFASRGLTATFFVVGNSVRAHPQTMRQIVERGFDVGNHSLSHQYSPSVIAREIAPMNNLMSSYTGAWPVYFRSPGLTQGSVIQNTLRNLGMCNVFTSVDLRDWTSPRRSASQLCSSFSASLHPGMIVLLHDGGTNWRPTSTAVSCMLDVALARGYRVVSLGELMRSGQPVLGFAGDFSPRPDEGLFDSAE